MSKFSFSPNNDKIILHNLPPTMEIQVIFNDEADYDVNNDVYEVFYFIDNKIIVKWLADEDEMSKINDYSQIRRIS